MGDYLTKWLFWCITVFNLSIFSILGFRYLHHEYNEGDCVAGVLFRYQVLSIEGSDYFVIPYKIGEYGQIIVTYPPALFDKIAFESLSVKTKCNIEEK